MATTIGELIWRITGDNSQFKRTSTDTEKKAKGLGDKLTGIGKIAGAGIADHIHTHIVPRWQGDTNFMPVVANTKVLSEALTATYNKLKESISNIL